VTGGIRLVVGDVNGVADAFVEPQATTARAITARTAGVRRWGMSPS
jgi:hypothetical protein